MRTSEQREATGRVKMKHPSSQFLRNSEESEEHLPTLNGPSNLRSPTDSLDTNGDQDAAGKGSHG